MCVLNINELKVLAQDDNLLGDDYVMSNFQPSSYDLRIGAIFLDNKIFSKEFQQQGFTNNIDIKPSEIVSILTLEKVTLPKNCIGTVFAINKQSSTGLLILNPGHIDPGFSGSLSICAINLSKEQKTISIGESIFTLIVQRLTNELSADQAYKNKIFNSRKEEEQEFLKTKSKRLSNSVFDLVSGYDGAKKMLADKLLEKFWSYIKYYVKILAVIASIAGILKLGYDAFPDSMPVFKKRSYNETEKSIIKEKDSIIRIQNTEIKYLKDSIESVNSKNKY